MAGLERVKRLLELPPYLQQHPNVGVESLAVEFGVSAGQIVRDVETLAMCGFATWEFGEMVEIDLDALDEGRVVMGTPQTLRHIPMRLGASEAIGLIVALEAIAEATDAATSVRVRQVVEKLGRAVGEQLADRISVTVGTGDEVVVTGINEAIRDGARLRLEYAGEKHADLTRPVIDPVRLEMVDGAWYLRAYSLPGRGWRTYRLDRVLAVSRTGEPVDSYQQIPDAVTAWVDEFEGHDAVDLELAASAAWVCEYFPVTDSCTDELGNVSFRMYIDDPAWFARFLLRLGDQVLAVRPDDALQVAREMAAEQLELIAAYTSPVD